MTAEGRRLTERHRLDQIANRRQFLAEFLALWALLDPLRLDETSPGWIRAVLAVLGVYRQRSADLSAGYYLEHRAVEVPATAPLAPSLPAFDHPPLPDRLDLGRRTDTRTGRADVAAPRLVRARDEQRRPRIDWGAADRRARTSLLVTGPINIKRRTGAAQPLRVVRRQAFAEASEAAGRHVQNGGRETVLTLVQADDVALGWARVTDGDPCYFCAMLASRGGVFKTRESAAFQPHDRCGCVPVPIYDRASAFPGRAREFQALWRESTTGTSGKDSIRAFRRAYEADQRTRRRQAAA